MDPSWNSTSSLLDSSAPSSSRIRPVSTFSVSTPSAAERPQAPSPPRPAPFMSQANLEGADIVSPTASSSSSTTTTSTNKSNIPPPPPSISASMPPNMGGGGGGGEKRERVGGDRGNLLSSIEQFKKEALRATDWADKARSAFDGGGEGAEKGSLADLISGAMAARRTRIAVSGNSTSQMDEVDDDWEL